MLKLYWRRTSVPALNEALKLEAPWCILWHHLECSVILYDIYSSNSLLLLLKCFSIDWQITTRIKYLLYKEWYLICFLALNGTFTYQMLFYAVLIIIAVYTRFIVQLKPLISIFAYLQYRAYSPAKKNSDFELVLIVF